MKFKVFDKEKKEFVDPQKFYIDCNGDIIEADYNLEPMTYYLDIVNDKFIPIFSTDQKDIEGTELYEGDVIRSFTSANIPITNIVHYDETDGKWNTNQAWLTEFEKKKIGSIYTNFELIEKND